MGEPSTAGATARRPGGGMRVAVLGPGGVGALLGALLARAGAQVVCLARADTADAIRTGGLSVHSRRFGDFTVPAYSAERLEQPVDLCLVTVKATHLEGALERVPADVLGGALMVPLLNGVEHVVLLRERYPAVSVVAAAIRVESTRIGPGEVRHDSPFASLVLATADGAVAGQVREVAGLLEQAGLDVTVDRDEGSVLWGKLGFLAPMALLTTHARGPAGVVREKRRATWWLSSARSRRLPAPRALSRTRPAYSPSSTGSRRRCSHRCSATRLPAALSSSRRSAGRSCEPRRTISCRCP